MSDVLNFIDTVKFKNQDGIGNNHCLNYVHKSCVSTEDIVLTILVSYKWLRHLCEARKKGLKCDFIEVLNIYLADNYCSVKIKKGCTHDCRRIHLQRSNKWDAPKDVLLVEKRIENLSDYERAPRKYRKQDANYWEMDIKESRAKRTRVCTELTVPQGKVLL
jgi:hypothetical protein